MKNCFLLYALFVFGGGALAAEVAPIVKKYDEALRTRNGAGLQKLISPEVKVTVDWLSEKGWGKKSFKQGEYIDYITKVLSGSKELVITRHVLKNDAESTTWELTMGEEGGITLKFNETLRIKKTPDGERIVEVVQELPKSTDATQAPAAKAAAPYEIVLVGEKLVFADAESVSSQITVRNLEVKKMIAPELYWGLSVVWDGKEYKRKRDPKHGGEWNGAAEIPSKTVWSTAFGLSEYLVPVEMLTAGRHTIALKDASTESNTLTVFVEKAK